MADKLKLRPGRANNSAADEVPDDPTAMIRVTSPVRTRRRPLFLVLGVALVAVLIVGSVALVNGLRATQTVLALASDVRKGQQLRTEDLVEITINKDAGLPVLLASQRSAVVNRFTTAGLPKGTLLSGNLVTEAVVPGPNLSLAAVTVSVERIPFGVIKPGDQIRIIDTPQEQTAFNKQPPDVACVQVVDIMERKELNVVTLNVLAREEEVSFISARNATKRIAVAIDNSDRDSKKLCATSPGPDR